MPERRWIVEVNGEVREYIIGRRLADDLRLYECMAQHYAIENERLRTELRYRQVIETYNRAHGQNKKITLKDICAQEGVSYDAVRQFRSRSRKRETAE